VKKILLLLGALLVAGVQAGELKPYSGAPLPDFTLSDMGGASHTLGHYRGQVVMVNFWATYCGPCIREIPSMQRLRERLADKPFEILAIDMAEERANVAAFLQHHRIAVNFPILLDTEGTVLEQWMVSAVPTTFIIDPEGEIRYALHGGLEWDSDEVIDTINGLLQP
jgi:thiol-disulfide isomerase/thioredoxin